MSSRKVISVLRPLMPEVQTRLEADYELRLNPNNSLLSAPEILSFCREADGVIALPPDVFSKEVIQKLPARLKIIACHSVGTDNVDLAAARTQGITVTNTPDVLNDATAEVAIMLMLAASHRAIEGDRMIRQKAWNKWGVGFMLGRQVTGARLGIIGMGRIGQIMARRARAFEMEIHYFNRRRIAPDQEQGAIYHEKIESLLAVADFLSLHCPSTPDTRNLLNTETIALLPDGAVVVNTARGDLVDDRALASALRSGKLSAAGLDVFNGEPKVYDDYLTLPNMILTPHIGSATTKTRIAMGMRAADNIDAFFNGKAPPDKL